jgi:hypothetical protein
MERERQWQEKGLWQRNRKDMIQGVTLSFICWIDQFNDYHQQDAHPE